MAEIKLSTMSYKEIGEKGARYALDEVEYNGLTIRQWADKITGGEYAPVVHGHWDKPTKPFPYWDWKCSVCGCEEYRQRDSHGHYRIMKYCPNCGAKMDEEGGNDS